MDYRFNGKEIFINKVTLLGKVFCSNYNCLDFTPIFKNRTLDKTEIKSEIHRSGFLQLEESLANQVTAFTFNIISEKRTDAVFFFDTSPSVKLWLNDEIILSKDEYVNGIFCRTLKKGKNVIYGEFYTPSPTLSHFCCRVSRYETENKRTYDNITDSMALSVNSPSVDFFATDEGYHLDTSRFVDCIFPRDIFRLDTEKDIMLDVLPGNSDIAFDSFRLRYNTKYYLNFDKYRRKLDKDTYYIVLKYGFEEYGGTVQTAYRMFIIKDFTSKAAEMIAKEKETNELWNDVYENIVNLKRNPQQFYSFYLRLLKEHNMLAYDEKKLHGGNIAEINIDRRYFKSKIDGKTERYFIRKPTAYDENKKYPLFLFISINHSISYYSHLINNDCYFVADSAGRGVTGGSSIGEVSVLEVLSQILRNYNVDEKKIYLAGYSNGGFAAINILQHHPDMFAGAFTMSALCNKNLLYNIQDKKCINIYSDFDNRVHDRCFPESDNGNHIDVMCPVLTHRLLGHYFAQPKAFKELLEVSLDLNPRQIHAKTYSLQHRKYYWFEFLDISFGFEYAKADVVLCEDGKIKVNIENCGRFKIYLPFNTEKKSAEFEINGKEIRAECKSEYLIFEKTGDEFYLSEDKEEALSLKGTGLLSVYYDSLQIYTSGDDPVSETVAKNFSSPCTQGYDPKVYTEYQICDIDCFDPEKNAVIIDDLSRGGISETVRSNLFVKVSKDGFSYGGKTYRGEYSVLQIIRSPFNREKTILHIATDDIKLLRKNIFLRKVILSFDFNGRNPHWNNEALIFYNNKYYTVYENGSPIMPY